MLFDRKDMDTLLSPVILEPDHLPALTEVLKQNGIENGTLQPGETVVYLPEFSWMIQGGPEPDDRNRSPQSGAGFRGGYHVSPGYESEGRRYGLAGEPGRKIRTVTVRTVLRKPLNYIVDYQGRLSAWTGGFAWPYAVIVPAGFFGTDSVNHVEVWSPDRRDAAMQSQMAALASQGDMLLTNDAARNREYCAFLLRSGCCTVF